MKKWIAILCAVAMLSLLCLTACGTPAETDEATGTESAATDAEEITIGVFGPLTGTMAIGGTRQQDGISYAIEKINANGGLCDGKYTLNAIFEDTEGNSENAVTIMNKFLYKDEVACTMGSNNSPEVLAILDMLTESGTPHIVPSGVNMAIIPVTADRYSLHYRFRLPVGIPGHRHGCCVFQGPAGLCGGYPGRFQDRSHL